MKIGKKKKNNGSRGEEALLIFHRTSFFVAMRYCGNNGLNSVFNTKRDLDMQTEIRRCFCGAKLGTK